MKLQDFQLGELRDENDNIIQKGTYGKTTAFANADNTGILDYIMNNLQVLYNKQQSGTDTSKLLTKDEAKASYLGINATANNAVRSDSLNITYLGGVSGKTVGDFKALLLDKVKSVPAYRQLTVAFSVEPTKLIENWNNGNDNFVLTDGGAQYITIGCRISSPYAFLEWRTYYPSTYHRCVLTNGVWSKWEKIVTTTNGSLTSDVANKIAHSLTIKNSNGSTLTTFDGSQDKTLTLPNGSVNMSNYYTKQEVDAAIQAVISNLKGE